MKYTILARYGAMRSIGTFASDIRLRLGDRCLLHSDRGTEWGEVLSGPERNETEPEAAPKTDGVIIRRPTAQDHERQRVIEDVDQAREFTFCAQKIAERTLPMRLASVEHIFGGEKIIFYFLAEGRVDFRSLVKDLATEYHTRIELRQIGVRDEARLLAEYEHCGRELCCRTFIQDLEPVTMRMAKLQKTTLDPTKISGRCGRLMCCLRFEDETYADLKTKLPKKGTRIRYSEGIGEVISSAVLAQTVTIEAADHKIITIPNADVLERLPQTAPPAPQQAANGPETDADRERRRPPRRPPRRRDDDRPPEGAAPAPRELAPQRAPQPPAAAPPQPPTAPKEPVPDKTPEPQPPSEELTDDLLDEPDAETASPETDNTDLHQIAPETEPDDAVVDDETVSAGPPATPGAAPTPNAPPNEPAKPEPHRDDSVVEEWWEDANDGEK